MSRSAEGRYGARKYGDSGNFVGAARGVRGAAGGAFAFPGNSLLPHRVRAPSQERFRFSSARPRPISTNRPQFRFVMNSDYFSFPTELDAATDLEVSPVSEVRFLKRREKSGIKIEKKKRLSEERLIEKYET